MDQNSAVRLFLFGKTAIAGTVFFVNPTPHSANNGMGMASKEGPNMKKSLIGLVAIAAVAAMATGCMTTPPKSTAAAFADQVADGVIRQNLARQSTAQANAAARADNAGRRRCAADLAVWDGKVKTAEEAVDTRTWEEYYNAPACAGVMEYSNNSAPGGVCPPEPEMTRMSRQEVCGAPLLRACLARARAGVIAGGAPTVAQVAEVDKDLCGIPIDLLPMGRHGAAAVRWDTGPREGTVSGPRGGGPRYSDLHRAVDRGPPARWYP